ncbi:MAG: hypothetical protein Q4B36_07200 [Tissierellia bacterium]|nr:hypothetical protein [Tissierellia bacterium]
MSNDNNFISDSFADLDYKVLEDGYANYFNEEGRSIEIITKIAYLIGVSEYFLDKEDFFSNDIISELNYNKNARIIRNLCMFRNAIIQNHGFIASELKRNHSCITSLPDLIPADIFESLRKDDVDIVKNHRYPLIQYSIDINNEISNRINNCKDLFPDWIVWDYIKNIFIMPNGNTKKGIEDEKNKYLSNKFFYPYKCYINWDARSRANILVDDIKFLTVIYKDNGKNFNSGRSKKIDKETKDNIINFIKTHLSIDIIVDSENVNPFRLVNALNNIDYSLLEKINKLIIIDDENTMKLWEEVDKYLKNFDIEHILMKRILKNKSLVDIGLTAKLCKEFYENSIDSFIIASSDSDMWAIRSQITNANYFAFLENEKTSYETIELLEKEEINYAFIEEFYNENNNDLQSDFIRKQVAELFRNSVDFNFKDVLNYLVDSYHLILNDKEIEQFYDSHIKKSELQIMDDGSIKLWLN